MGGGRAVDNADMARTPMQDVAHGSEHHRRAPPSKPSSMAISAPTVTNYIGLLVDLLLVRRLKPFHANLGKRLVKSPKVYVREVG